MKKDLVSVYEDTMNDLKRGYYENSFGEEIEFQDIEVSYYYKKIPKVELSYKDNRETKIYVENIDSFIKAIEFGKSGVVLNMASFKFPGGGVERGSRAQEEDLCRRSNLLSSLYRYNFYKAKELGIEYAGDRYRYPLDKGTALYSRGVSIYKKPNTYEPYYEPYITNVISMPAIKHPKLSESGNLMPKSSELMKEKIRIVLRIALKNGHTKIVLGAWGCGAYGLPAPDVALCFKEVLDESGFQGKFDEICFAILEDHNSQKTGGNLKPFTDIFGINS